MKNIELGQVLSILANFGVLLGILLLAYELNQNRNLTAAQIRNDTAVNRISIALSRATDGELADIVLRVQDLGEEVTPVERARYEAWTFANFRAWENVSYQNRSGLLDDSEYMGIRDVWRQLLAGNDVVYDLWCDRGGSLSRAFSEEMNALLADRSCE